MCTVLLLFVFRLVVLAFEQFDIAMKSLQELLTVERVVFDLVVIVDGFFVFIE